MSGKAKDDPKQPTGSEKPSTDKGSPTSDNLGLDVLKEIEEEEPDLLEPLSAKDRKRLGYLLQARVVSKIYRGPLPPPEDIAAYDNHIPDGANRIMCMAEEALKSRIKIGELSLEAQIKQSGRGQMFGLLIGLSGIATGAILALMGCEVVGGIIAGSTVVSLATAFITGQKQQRASSREQRNTN